MPFPLTCRKCHGAGTSNAHRLIRIRPRSNQPGVTRLKCCDCGHEFDSKHPDARFRPLSQAWQRVQSRATGR